MKQIDPSPWKPRWLTAVAAAALLTAVGCGGHEEPRVTVWRELLGPPPIGDFPAADASIYDEAQLNHLGVRTSNKRCAKASGLFGGLSIVFFDGIVPRYVLFDIPASDVAKAESLWYVVYQADQDFMSTPFWDCSIEGY